MSGSEGGGGTVLPDWLGELKVIATVGPQKWVAQRIVDFILGAIGAFAFSTANLLDGQFSIITTALDQAFGPLSGVILGATDLLTATTDGVNNVLFSLTAFAGPFAPVFVIAFWAAVVVLLWRALVATLPAAIEVIGSVPVIGGAVAAIMQWALDFTEGLTNGK